MRFFSFILCAVLICSMAVTSFALELDEPLPSIPADSGVAEELEDGGETSVSEVIPEDEVSSPEVAPEDDEENPELGIENTEDDVLVGVTFASVAPITPSDTNGLKAVLLEVLGDYDPIIVEYEYRNQNNTYNSYLREVLPDYPWCASFIMLSLFVYCVFRLGGALIG